MLKGTIAAVRRRAYRTNIPSSTILVAAIVDPTFPSNRLPAGRQASTIASVEAETIRATLPCLTALNVYELALLGTLLFIVLRENITDDAISLVVLVALFMVGSGVALTCVSGTEPRPALLIGGIALALAVGKLLSLRAFAGLALRGPLLVGLLTLVAWNFLVGPLLAQRHASITDAMLF